MDAPRPHALIEKPFALVGATTPFHRMRLVATLLLVLMAIGWVSVLLLRSRQPGWIVELGYARAFFEAAMIGGLADWFAVTALFRHPLGLPIPHTAIIPSNKDRIGDSLALFLKENFLTPGVVARRLEGFDLAGTLGRWLTAPPTRADAKAGRLRRALSKLLLQFADALDGNVMAQLIGATVTDRLRDRAVAPMLGKLLRPLIDGGRHEPFVETLLIAGMAAVEARQDEIHAAVAARAPKYMPGFVDRGYAKAFIDAVQDHLYAMTDDAADAQRRDAVAIAQGFRERLAALEGQVGALPPPTAVLALGRDHPDRQALTQRLRGIADALSDPASNAARQVEAMKLELIDSPAVAALFASLWTSVKTCSPMQSPARATRGRAASRVQRGRSFSTMRHSPMQSTRSRDARRSASSAATATQSFGSSATRYAAGMLRR